VVQGRGRGCKAGEVRVTFVGLNQKSGLPLSFFRSFSGNDFARRMGDGGGETCIVDRGESEMGESGGNMGLAAGLDSVSMVDLSMLLL